VAREGRLRDQLLSPWSFAALGILLVSIGLAERLAFFSFTGVALVVLGFATLLIAAAKTRKGAMPVEVIAFPALLVALLAVSALAPFLPGAPDAMVTVLTVAAALSFYGLGMSARLRRYRLWACAGLLVAAHAAFILAVPHPEHQDVFRFLNLGVDVLLKGQDPYAYVHVPAPDVFKFTYPPGALLLVAPFRVLFGDIRWSYIAAEILTTVLIYRLFVSAEGAQPRRWQEAVILLPLALPRVDQAYLVFSNHEWLLLALTAGALLAGARRQWLVVGALLGVGICAKQYFVLFPVMFLLPWVPRRSLALAVAVAAAVTVPFVVWDARDFWFDITSQLSAPPDTDRVTLWATLYHLGLDTGGAGARVMGITGLAIVAGAAWWGRRGLAQALCACGLALSAQAFLSPFAAYNYYAYGLVFLTWGLILPRRWPVVKYD
jgi:hypothetical protein